MRELSRYVLRTHVRPFAYTFIGLTLLQLDNPIRKHWPDLLADQHPTNLILQVIFLSLPYIVTTTLPMATLLAVLYASMRLARDKQLSANLPGPITVSRVATPVLAAALVLAVLALLWSDQVLPRSNRALTTLLIGIQAREPSYLPSDRTMSISELRHAALSARNDADRAARDAAPLIAGRARRQAAMFEVEIHKKYAVAAACLVLAFFGVAVGFWIRRGLVFAIITSFVVWVFYYVWLIGGEALANRLIVSPFAAMWTPNLILGILGILALWRLRGRRVRPSRLASAA